MPKLGLGVDIGGSGIKGAVVDLAVGGLATERYKVLTPRPSTPGAVADVVAEVVGQFGWEGPIGCTFPAVVRDGVALTAANVDSAWIGTNIESVVGSATGLPVVAVNDADAAGIAEARWGAGKDAKGLVIVVTLGTGIGTALFYNGALIPNSELGHLELDGNDYEQKASAGARERERSPLGQVGQAPPALFFRHRGAFVARPFHRGRRGQPAGGKVPADGYPQYPDSPSHPPERGRYCRRRLPICPGEVAPRGGGFREGR